MDKTLNLKIKISSKLIIGSCLFLLTLTLGQLISTPSAHAASLSINGSCSLDDAVDSLNNASDLHGCTATGPYGTNDTINIPAGTYSYSASHNLSVAASIKGAGMGETILDYSGATGGSLAFVNPGSSPLVGSVSGLSIKGLTSPVNAIDASNFNLIVQRVEIYSDSSSAAGSGISVNYQYDGFSSTIEDVYIHDIDFSTGPAISISIDGGGATSVNNIIRNSTIENVNFSNQGFAILYAAYGGGGTLNGVVENSTMQDIDAAHQVVYIFAYADTLINPANASVSVITRNNTFRASRDLVATGGVALLSASISPAGYTATTEIESENNIIAGNVLGSQELPCGASYAPGAGGAEITSILSNGGNITDDNCSTYFNHVSDHNSVANLNSFFGPLQNNGGLTPTMALLAGSPAIDTGVFNSLTVDQRGISRPQGAAFDSGAYEYASVTNESSGYDGSGSTNPPNELADTGQDITIIRVLSVFLIVMPLVLAGMANRKRIYKLR